MALKLRYFPRMPLLQSSRDLLTIPMRLALALAFLSAVADRCGLLGPPGTPGVTWGNFANFLSYSAAINSFAPSMLQLALAITATILEGSLGVLLLVGLFTRSAAVAASLLLLSFAAAMTISLGIKPVLDYSVLSASFGALFLAAEDRYPLSVDALLTSEFWRPFSWKQLKQ
jgi:putative oxidoreductase